MIKNRYNLVPLYYFLAYLLKVTMTSVDTILSPQFILTIAPKQVLSEHSIAINAGKIVAIFKNDELNQWQTSSHIQLPSHTIMPGLINAHAHSAMSLLRGKADDLALMDWLQNHIWPAETANVGEQFVFDGSLIAMAEMLRCGTTTVNDMYFYNDAVARASVQAGMRTFVGCSILDFPSAYAANADAHIAKALAEIDQFGEHDLVKFTLAPHAPYTVSNQTFEKIFKLAQERKMRIHCHIHETAFEVEESIRIHGVRPLQRLDDLGVFEHEWMAAHMVHLNDAEIEFVARKNISVLHNPASNMKLASGIARIPDLLKAGVNVALGTDGAASNNSLDMLSEMRLAALLAKVGSGNPTDVAAHTVLEMATINGARALGMEDKIGSVTVGKMADLIAIDLAEIETMPLYDPISHIVYAAGREQVTHVWVNGKMLLENRELLSISLDECMEKAAYWQKTILAK